MEQLGYVLVTSLAEGRFIRWRHVVTKVLELLWSEVPSLKSLYLLDSFIEPVDLHLVIGS